MKDGPKCQAICSGETTSNRMTIPSVPDKSKSAGAGKDFSCEKVCLEDIGDEWKCRALCLSTDPTMETCQREDSETLACADGIYRKAADVYGSGLVKAIKPLGKQEKKQRKPVGSKQ